MSNTRKAAVAPVAQFADPGKRKIVKADWVPFRIGEQLFHLVTPKTYDLSQILMVIDSPTGLNDPENMRMMLRFAAHLVRYIVDEPRTEDGLLQGRALIEHRLSDPEDNMDLPTLIPVLMDLVKQLVDRPTGPPRAFSAPRRAVSAGRVSRARTPSTTVKTSTRSRRSST